ncbi:MAG: hypothetical protein WBF51_04305 [Candidatus Dormiibacterota bacterium]
MPQIVIQCPHCNHRMKTWRSITTPQSIVFTCARCKHLIRRHVTAEELAVAHADEIVQEAQG